MFAIRTTKDDGRGGREIRGVGVRIFGVCGKVPGFVEVIVVVVVGKIAFVACKVGHFVFGKAIEGRWCTCRVPCVCVRVAR